jgi:hypothetical protein
MRILKTGDVFYGKSHADMINKAIGTNYYSYMKSSVELSDFGCSNVIAWFVYMDGSIHGYEDGWRWANRLSLDGLEISEYNVSDSKEKLKKRRVDAGYNPYRLAFQIDHNGTGNKHCCKFVGAFRLKSFIKADASSEMYEKVLDEFKLLGKGEYGGGCNDREDFIPKEGKYLTAISEMGFSQRTFSLLKNSIKNAGELLELGIGIEGPIADEIQDKICSHFYNK